MEQVSEDSQGLEGAQAMYDQQQMLQSRIDIMAISDFIEPAIKDYATQATATYSAPIDTSKFTGRQFVAGEDPLQSQAIRSLLKQGVGAYQPFLSAAQTAQQQAAWDCWWTWCVSNRSRWYCTRCSRLDRSNSFSTFHVTISTTSY